VNDLFASVTITDGAAGQDAINIQYYDNPSNDNFKLALTSLRSTMPQSSSELNVNSTYACDIGDLAIVSQAGSCTLMEVTQVQGSALKLQHNPGGTPTYNPPVPYQGANGWPAYSTGASMQCFSRLYKRTYDIQGTTLRLTQPDAAWVMQSYEVVPHIIALQAQYGIADAGSQQVNAWVNATGAWASPLPVASIRRIKAVRLSLVARSAEFEKPDTTGVCATTTPAMVADWSSWATFDTGTGTLSGTPSAATAGKYSNIVISVSDGKAAASLAPFAIDVTATNRPPAISGSPGTTATVGQPYSFTPTASDPDGQKLTFSIVNKPAWATFDTVSGRLYGTPADVGAGTYSSIQISASDGQYSAVLPAFSIAVQKSSNGTATLSWVPPTTNVDGTPVTNLAGYRIAYGQYASNLTQSLEVPSAAVTSAVIENLTTGTWYFAVKAYTTNGIESDLSNLAQKTVL